MKRIAQYILILVVMIGLFSPIFNLTAQTVGQCVDGNGVGLPNISFGNCNPPNKWTLTVCFEPKVLQNGQCKPCTPPTVYSVLGGCVTPVSPTLPLCITDRTTGQPINSPCRTISTPTTTSNYHLLAPINIPGGITDFDPSDPNKPNALGEYLNLMLKIFIGLCAVLAVVMIVMGGIEYMTTELVHTKEAGKERITNALLGLLIALGAYALLNTINPDLLKTDIKIDRTIIAYAGAPESSVPFTPISQVALQGLGINCTGSGGNTALASIAQSFGGKTTYSMTARNTANSTAVFADCSSFVAQVYKCAGLNIPGNNTGEMFGGASAVTVTNINGTKINGTELQVGDLLGWKQGGGEQFGHVVMYIGNGNVIDAQRTGVAVRPLNSPQFQGRLKYIKKI